MLLDFYKMEGAGNDYVYVDTIHQDFPLQRAKDIARSVADRHFGVGGDGLILLARGEQAPARMLMFNADGSRGSMCGNGLRCVAKLAWDVGAVRERSFVVETDAGPRPVELSFDGDEVVGAVAEMGDLQVAAEAETTQQLGRAWSFIPVDAGNDHAVIFVDEDPEDLPVLEVGAAIQALPRFPNGVNVEFVQQRGPALLVQRTFERGSGETLACGSGATAVAAAAWQTGRVSSAEAVIEVRLRGGKLRIHRRPAGLAMEGPARTVFRGQIEV